MFQSCDLQEILCPLGIPALVPIVEDVFLVRGTSSASSFDLKELETQREVLVSMLLRLVEYHQVSPFTVLIPHHSNFTVKITLWQKDYESRKVYSSEVHIFSKCIFSSFMYLIDPDAHILRGTYLPWY